MTSYLFMYEHAFTRKDNTKIAQYITDLIALRPRIDLTRSYFAHSYHTHTQCLHIQAALLTRVVTSQISMQRKLSATLYQHDWRSFTRIGKGLPSSVLLHNCSVRLSRPCVHCTPTSTNRTSQPQPADSFNIRLLDAFPSACMMYDV